ncbi:hypothetical protein EVAR_69428_1 [Eumeta japonica]|uniref:Uncharacterized protein n=1 Tax=Eumeta variegata TaxID=151549 RepID=A0A4C2A5E5_EUMVA|nr:hypothetical protein EVAR_69428_1 [Eumeta japonica]
MPDRPKRRKNNKNKRKNKSSAQPHHEKPLSDSIAPSANEKCDPELKEALCEPQTDLTSTSDNGCNSHSNVSSRKSSESLDNFDELNQSHKPETDIEQQNLNNLEPPQAPQINKNLQKTVNDVLSEIKCINNYIVESPKQSSTNVPKLGNTIKSRSLDNDDIPKIIEITDEPGTLSEEEGNVPVVDCNNTVVSEAESDVEWETTDNLDNSYVSPNEVAVGTLSIQTIALNVAQCEHNQVLTPEEELSLRQYLHSLDLTTNPVNVTSLEIESRVEIQGDVKQRLRKKGMTEDFLRPRIPVSRFLDVIDEEGSSESSSASRRQSQLSDKRNDFDDLEDEVFIDSNVQNIKSEKHPLISSITNRNYKRLMQNIPQQCFLVGAKIVEPKIMEAKGDWSMKTVEKMKGAEVVYLTDSSSSTSDIYDINDETELNNDTDASVRIITPTIEVTDTESLLKSVTQNKISIDDQEKTKIQTDNSDTLMNNELSSEKCQKSVTNFTDFGVPYESHPHEILILSTDNIKTDLYVLDSVEELKQKTKGYNETLTESNEILTTELQNKSKDDIDKANTSSSESNDSKKNERHDIEIKVLKCELNDAFNNLLKEVSSDSDIPNEEPSESFHRQDSSSSIGSSQCTAKYNPNYSSINDIGDAIHEEAINVNNRKQELDCKTDPFTSSHVRDVLKSIPGTSTFECKNQFLNTREFKLSNPEQLREICVKKIATFPYGEKILEELASVSERLQNINMISTREKAENQTVSSDKQFENVSRPLFNVSTTDKYGDIPTSKTENTPPPLKPRRSSRKKSREETQWADTSTKMEPVYVCLSPSQKMLMEKTNTKITKEDISHSNDITRKTTERRHSDYQNYKPREEQSQIDKTNFKSQTGNRLLAILRDPTITSTINRVNNNNLYKSLDNLSSNYKHWETKLPEDKPHQQKRFLPENLETNSFKPIPPPRPRYYSSTAYESDENSDFASNSFRSMKCERKLFHYSTGNLSKEIENDISSIQNLHRNYTALRNNVSDSQPPRRPSLPKELCDIQMEYIKKKELEVQNELRRLETRKIVSPEKKMPRAPLIKDSENTEKAFTSRSYNSLNKKDILFNKDNIRKPFELRPFEEKKSSFRSSQEELMRERMYSEYVCEMAERHERKQQKIIKITNNPPRADKISKSLSALHLNDIKSNNIIEEEFISKAKERWNKLGIRDPETEDERETKKDVYREPKVIEHKIKVIESGAEKDVQKLPKHIQEFVRFTAKSKERPASGSGESRDGSAPLVLVLCAVMIIVFAMGKQFLRIIRNGNN